MKDYNFNQVFLNIIDSGASKQLVSFLHLNNISANISEKSLSILLAKASFAFLLISMLSYWFQMSFKSQRLMNSFRKNSERIPQKLVQPERNSERVVSTNSEEIPKELCQRVVSTNSQLRVRRKPLIPSSVAELRIPAQRLPLWGTRGKKQSFAKDKGSGVVLTSCANELILSKGVTPCKASLCNPLQGVRSKGYIEDLQEADHKSQAITYTKTDRKNLYYFLEKVPFVSMWSANITLALLLSIRWIESGHFPLSNLYESLIFLSWSLTVIHLFLENFFNKREQREPSTLKILGSQAEYSIPLQGKGVRVAQLNFKYPEGVRSKTPTLTLGAITSPVALFTNAFATFSLPQEMQKVTVLVPALKSNWLIMHVSVMIISYAALLSGSLLAMAFLVIKFIDDNKVPSIMFTFINPLPLQGLQSEALQSFGSIPLNRERSKVLGIPGYQESETKGSKPLLLEQRGSLIKENKGLLPQILDNLSYRSISLGFALLTIGILSGAVWANEAWGSYWSWDPKETWALITWLIFALYLHTRLSKGWVGKESAFVASFGFIVIWFCYLGVNLFGKGLHSYGWFQQ